MRIVLILLMCFLGIQQVSAQYGGRRGSSGRMSQQPRTPMPAPEPVSPEDVVAAHLDEYQETFDLDNFEIEVLRNYLVEHITSIQELQTDRTKKPEDIREAYDKLQSDFKQKLSAIMTEEEVNQLIAMDFSRKAERKRKKGKKN
ncbi:MAG: hypothetical protein V7767_02725 [Leeuwenhoekiella sp.]